MTLAECREIVDMYDGAASSERRQLTTLLGRLDDIADDLQPAQADLAARCARSPTWPTSAANGWTSSPADRSAASPRP